MSRRRPKSRYAVSFRTVFLWLACFALTSIAPTLFGWSTQQFGNPSAVFYLCAGVSLASFAYLWMMLPETNRKTLEEIGQFWRKEGRDQQGQEA